jgi:colicin import membrane protein
MPQSSSDLRAFLLSVGIHVALALVLWLGLVLRLPQTDQPAAGEPVQATLELSKADQQRVKMLLAQASKDEPPAPAPAKPPQPIAEKAPQDSETPLQPTPQAPVDLPDPEDQEKIVADAALASEQKRLQDEKRRQEQVELTEDIVRQEQAERRQRLREQQLQIQRELEAAQKRRKLEEQKLQQLADLRSAPRPTPAPATQAPPGERGVDESLLAKYRADMLRTAEQNWNHIGAPELARCKVRFGQIPGGVITKVEFIDCPYDEQGREFVDRALRKDPMPYQGYEKVFMPRVELTFCYPKEDCQ